MEAWLVFIGHGEKETSSSSSSSHKKMSKSVTLLSKREPLIEYRPHTHHKLHVNNGIFDLSYSAYLWCKSIIETKYTKVIERCFGRPAWLNELVMSAKLVEVPTVCFIECGQLISGASKGRDEVT